MNYLRLVWLQFLVCSGSGLVSSQQVCLFENRQTLRLLVSLPFPNRFPLFNPSWNEGDKVLPSLYLARDQINARTDVLPCHQLELVRVDGGCDIVATTAISTGLGLFDQYHRRVVGIVGPGCSASTLQTAYVTNQPNIELVNIHGGGSPRISDRRNFNNSLGILGSTQSFVNVLVELMKENDWHNIAILFESGRVYYRSTKEQFLRELRSNSSYSVNVRFESPVYTTFYPLDGVRNSLSRIVLLFTSLDHTRRILCLAYHSGMFYPAYQWVIVSHRFYEIADISSNVNISFTYDKKPYSCSPASIIDMVMHGTFLINYQLSSNDTVSQKPKFANTTFDEFLELYKERALIHNVPTTIWAYYFYDAVWAWARVLHRMIEKSGSEIFNNFQYGNKTIASLMLEEFYANDFRFEGMSGSISFQPSNGFYDRTFNLYQIVNREEVRVAYSNDGDIQKVEGVSQLSISDIVRADTSVNAVIIAFFEFLQFILFIVLIVLHVLTVLYRESRSVKASSPKLSHFSFAGAYLILVGLIMFLFLKVRENAASVSGPICHVVWVWIFPISLTLTIGTVIVRTWRLYRIFAHYLNPGKFISNHALITMLIVMLSIDVIIAVIWSSIDPRQLIITTDTIKNDQATELVVLRNCRSRYDRVWLGVVISYKLSLLTIMVVLAFLTRRIPNKTFSTTSLRVFSYTFSAVFGIGFALYFFFLLYASARYRLNSNISISILSATSNIMVFLIIACVLGPPLVPVIREKQCTKSLLQQLSNLRKKRERKPSVYDQEPDAERVRKTSTDVLLWKHGK